ncbi:Hypothetical predicted protein [Olea europaea subsp. europaea]|uniref:Disease resistance protein At4g27190-like leucine-rich repeats domain-containing protein n=1 Tax=Olea europaea subsp. europaea TaxID=158383 RepID=A0A8S0PRS9_OLEEU|nr:Hypothetical predicted protein [Olea europaea subsp. europaea]
MKPGLKLVEVVSNQASIVAPVGISVLQKSSRPSPKFPNLEELDIGGLDITIKILYEARQIRSLHKLRKLSVEHLNDVHILFDFDGLTVTEGRVESLLGQLKSLKMLNLPKLVHITTKVRKGIYVFKNLTSLDVGKCGSLRYLFSPSMANSLVALESLEVVDCEAIVEIVEEEEEEGTLEIEMVEERMANKIVFPNLYSLQFKNLERFRTFTSQNYKIVFPSLEKLEIRHCPVMTKFWLQQKMITAKELSISWDGKM